MDRRHCSGFTLIDAMVVLAILTVTLTVGMPSFSDIVERHRIASAMYLLTADMAVARSTAITRRQQVVVCPGDRNGCRSDRNWAGGWIVFLDPDKDRVPDAASDLLSAAAPLRQAGLEAMSSRGFLRYQSDGRSAATNLTVSFCSGNVLKGRVIVNNSGRVRTQRPDAAIQCRTD